MGIIQIEGMEFYAYHGCFKEEQLVGNTFKVDLYMEADCQKASESDNITDAVNYQIAYEVVKTEMEKTSHLLEHVSGRILKQLFISLPEISAAKVKVCKLNPPLGGKIQNVNVTLSKRRSDYK